ncbi:hypothetical protein AB4Y32_07820 [Paraburkholderia phymatum]|uniref:Uncharacterized protein n=1 Tax=Paraburkholderia phymatum TaxID=148447 RepID=A0ACC6TWJ7_9BURK
MLTRLGHPGRHFGTCVDRVRQREAHAQQIGLDCLQISRVDFLGKLIDAQPVAIVDETPVRLPDGGHQFALAVRASDQRTKQVRLVDGGKRIRRTQLRCRLIHVRTGEANALRHVHQFVRQALGFGLHSPRRRQTSREFDRNVIAVLMVDLPASLGPTRK